MLGMSLLGMLTRRVLVPGVGAVVKHLFLDSQRM
jgi:hypothetical protein